MCRIIFIVTAVLYCLPVIAQRGDELLVYAVKGKVTSVFKNTETTVKVGKVLYPGMILKTEENASLTMLCTKGKPISVSRKGNYPVTKWKDSCKTDAHSVTANYFKFVWSQLYAYSPENKEEMRKRNEMAVARGEPFETIQTKKPKKLVFSKGMDIVCYDGRHFPLSWNIRYYSGPYYFKLYDASGGKLLYQDSLYNNFISLDSLKQFLVTGKKYQWTVSAKGIPVSAKKMIYAVPVAETEKLRLFLSAPLGITEDTAAVFFRTAYLMEQKHYLAEAYEWYLKAGHLDPEMELYRDQIIRFRNEFWIR